MGKLFVISEFGFFTYKDIILPALYDFYEDCDNMREVSSVMPDAQTTVVISSFIENIENKKSRGKRIKY